MNQIAKRVALKVAAMFNVGDVILYGKYKNKKGKILSFGKNDKGQPTIIIEPIPKGRKQNKEMGLYKIWTLPKGEQAKAKEEAKAEKAEKKEAMDTSHTSRRVASRFVKSFGIPLGKTWDSGTVRIHRYAESFLITDLTNAGKRGKKCKVIHVQPSYKYKGDKAGWMEQMSKALPDYDSFARVLAFFKDILVDYPGEIDISESEQRGIDVNPGGTTKIDLKTNTGIEISAEPLDFSVKTHVPMNHPKTGEPVGFQDTLYWPRKKPDAGIFYNWLKANLAEANRMDIRQFMKLWDDLGIRWDAH